MTTATKESIQHDYQLVCDAREHGSRRAYADLMTAYREPLYLLLLRMTRNATSAADLTLETFGKAFNQLHRYAPTGSFSSWLYSIGVNTYIDHLRRNKLNTIPLSSTAHDTPGDAVEYQIPSGQPNPEEELINAQRDQNIAAIVESLREPYRQIIRLRYYEDLSYEEIAERLSIPIGTVKVRLARAKELISTIINRKGGEL